MVGIRDVARHSQVSTATVARVLRGSGQVSEELTRRVLAAVEELGYVPNAVARSLTRGRTHLVGLVVPDISNPYFAEVARGLEDEAVKHGYHVLIGSSDLNTNRESELVSAFEARTVDAVVITPTTADPEQIGRLLRRRIPVVFVDRHLPQVPAPAVLTDNADAVRRAVDHLIELGHRDIAMISGPEHFETAADRVEGFRAAYRAHHRRIRRGHLQQGHLGVSGGQAAMRELLATRPRPTACVSFNNLLTIGALTALREAKVAVPHEMSLISFDDLRLFALVDPPITAIAQPAYDMGAKAAELVFRMLDGEEIDAETTILPTDFRLRASCAPPLVSTSSVTAARSGGNGAVRRSPRT
ncbi:MAG TPA: LacI family DNA-binding transcriptional regulator [Micromonosporaceae bacterium]